MSKESRVFKNVAVILGDPRKPDPARPSGAFDDNDLYTIDQLKIALGELEQEGNYRFTYLDNHDTLIQDLIELKGKVDFVFNLCDEGYYNDGEKELNVPALLEMLGILYTGAGPQCLAYCYDKSLVRGIAKDMKIPVPKAFFIDPGADFKLLFNSPLIVKPNFGDGGFGITQRSITHNKKEIMGAISEMREKFGYSGLVLVEEFLAGKDLTVGVIGNPAAYTVLPVAEENYAALPAGLPKICGFEAKWLPDSPYWKLNSVLANLPKETEKFIVECCLRLFGRLGCRDYCRFDWRLDADGNPKLLEVNPNPGWCWDGHMAKMAKIIGMLYAEMLKVILLAAEQRIGTAKII